MAALEMRDVSLTYHPAEGPVPAVRGVDLTVEPVRWSVLPVSPDAESRR